MSIEIIKSKLKTNGYHCYFLGLKNELIVGKITGSIPEIGANQVDVYCKVISSKDPGFTIEFFVGQIVEFKHFSNSTQVVNYILTTYPLT